MFIAHRSIIALALIPMLMIGCGSSTSSSERGSLAVPIVSKVPPVIIVTPPTGFTRGGGTTGSNDAIIATPSVAGTLAVIIGASQTLSVTFASNDGRIITGFGVSGTLGSLPSGWSGPASFTCAMVSTGSDCVLNLTYAPTAAGSGSVVVNYVFVDDSTLPRTGGSIAIPYLATTNNNIVAVASPTGQIDAVIGGGAQTVAVNFTTDDADAATNLSVDLTALPAGWTSAAPNLSCAIISTGSGCQLALRFAPTAAMNGTLTLAYNYSDDTGAAQTGAMNIPYSSTSANNIIATASPAGQIIAVQKTGGQSVPVSFTTNDGKSATQLFITSNLNKLPAGWSSTAASFACARVNTGNGCQLPLTYAPSTLTSGTLALHYAFTDAAGTARTGLLDVNYAATTNDNVVGLASPSGQISAIVGMGSQAVTVTFNTDDGRPATALQLTSSLSALPPGWTSSISSLNCSGLNIDSVCQLQLTYAPTAASSGTFALGYAYKNNAGESKTGTTNIAYRATTDDNVVGTPSLSSLTVRTGSSTTVTVPFTTDDGNPAGTLALTSPLSTLPAGWSAAANSFACALVSSSSSCILTLNFSPTAAAAGTLSLGFSYANDSGFLKSGTVTIAYASVTPYLYVANSNSSALSACALNVDNSVGTCIAAGSGFNAPQGIALNGRYAYVANSNGNSISRCTLDVAGALSNCAPTSGTFTAPTAIAINAAGTFAYIDQSAGLAACSVISSDGSLSGCMGAGAAFDPLHGITLSVDGSHLYGIHTVTSGGNPPSSTTVIDVCTVASDGTLATCAAAAASLPAQAASLVVQNSYLYVTTIGGALSVCPLTNGNVVGTCQATAAGVNAKSIAFIGPTAFLSTGSTMVFACPTNADGTLGTCTSFNDATFDATSGLVIR